MDFNRGVLASCSCTEFTGINSPLIVGGAHRPPPRSQLGPEAPTRPEWSGTSPFRGSGARRYRV